eukprot:SAG25_NODE_695_length_5897_cov_31.858917_7_plen_156_part_00
MAGKTGGSTIAFVVGRSFLRQAGWSAPAVLVERLHSMGERTCVPTVLIRYAPPHLSVCTSLFHFLHVPYQNHVLCDGRHPLVALVLIRVAPLPLGVKNYGLALIEEFGLGYFVLSALIVNFPFSCMWACVGRCGRLRQTYPCTCHDRDEYCMSTI